MREERAEQGQGLAVLLEKKVYKVEGRMSFCSFCMVTPNTFQLQGWIRSQEGVQDLSLALEISKERRVSRILSLVLEVSRGCPGSLPGVGSQLAQSLSCAKSRKCSSVIKAISGTPRWCLSCWPLPHYSGVRWNELVKTFTCFTGTALPQTAGMLNILVLWD